LASKDQFFAEKGTGGANPRSNAKALELWLARLKSETDKQPLNWIKQMIKIVPNERITTAGLVDQIHSYEDGHVYYNSCCNGEEESEDGTSYHGSILEEDAGAIEDSENSTEARMDGGAANTVLPTSNQDLNEVSIKRRALPLDRAASRGHEAVVRLLAEKGADVNRRGADGWTALDLAASRGHEAVVRLLAEKGATKSR
jgi:Ankyrin repeats (many copies)